ncbi:unnamed protein product [Penicillium bialowiezense]
MSFLFGRRRSQSDVAPLRNETQRPSLRRAPSGRHQDDHSDRGFRGLFRRHSGDIPTLNIPEHDELHQTMPKRKQESNDRKAPHSPSRSQSISPTAGEHCEPKQPGNIQDLLEYRLDMATKPEHGAPSSTSGPQGGLTKNEVKAMLSGAPHFLLERGKHKRWYPQVIFPWDEQNSVVQHMWDRKPLPHASFTLSTLHAHLPVPDDWVVKGGVPLQAYDWRRTGATNRATFDIGIFEVPNMLSNNGKEPGTVGFRHFLELPVADAVRFTGPEEPKKPEYMRQLSTMGATEAYELMQGFNKPYSLCQSGAVFDRHRLISDGPEAWKRIGVRDINLRDLVQRLDHLRQFREDMLREGSTKTILDIESPHQLHESLHTRFLHPRPPPADILAGHPESVKSQIKTLAIVLATPGAWINFSLPEWRFRAGQVLWQASRHEDGDLRVPDPGNKTASGETLDNYGMERKWLLIQLLLSAELLLRLDAFVRVGMLHDPHGGNVTIQELRQFEKLRDGKVNWDLVVVRRFLNSLDISCPSPQPATPDSPQSRSSPIKSPEKGHRFAFLEALTRRNSFPVADLQSAWDCQLGSSHVRQQLEGLYVFAENIGWPRLANLKAVMELKLGDPANPVLPTLVVGRRDEVNVSRDASLTRADMYTRDSCRRRVKLDESGDSRSKTLGWISRSWLSGFVIPGEGISHLLMATILENDVEALDQLGTTASLYGGFTFGDRSWWSKACIVGRVLSSSAGARTCMGWISSEVLPCHATTLQKFESGWFELAVEEVRQCSSKPRIKQGAKLALESSPLGTADITASAFTLPRDPEPCPADQVTLESLTLTANDGPTKGIVLANEASISFVAQGSDVEEPTTISFRLKYNVRFVSAQQCRPPLGVASRSRIDEPASTNPPRYTRLTGHPLHRSYPYKFIPLSALPTTSAPSQDSETPLSPEIMVIDARGSRDRETFVRAWCASVGCHAIIGRSGRTCVACCVRQAKAIGVQVVVRVSD